MAKKTTSTKGYSDEKYLSIVNEELDKIEKQHTLVSGIAPFRRLSTGLLVMDAMTGGGYTSGMNTTSGQEASGKTTLNTTTLGQSISKIGINMVFDAENAINPEYTGIILQEKIKNVFGMRDAKNDSWLIRPKARYYDNAVIETIYGAMQSLLNTLPDKLYREQDNQWFYVFRNKKDETALMSRMGLSGTHSKSLFTRTGRYWCPTDNAKLQAAFFIDSYASLLTEDVDEEENEGNALALDARAFSKFLKRVRTKCRRKGAIIIGTNQLRKVPMAMYGPTETEPGGEALKFYSDCRTRIAARAVPSGWERKKGNSGVCVEDSVEYDGKTDEYGFKHLRNIKNKNGPPYLESWSRILMSDGNAQPMGFDPVFDTYTYLKTTGQLTGSPSSKTMVLTTSKDDKYLGKVRKLSMDYPTFKAWVLAHHRKDKDLVKKLMKTTTREIKRAAEFDLQAACFKQIHKGDGVDKFVKARDRGNDDDEDLEA